MVSPPTLQRHELGKSIHATFLYPTSFLPADTRYIVSGTGIYVPGIKKLAHSTKLSTSSLTRAVVSIAKCHRRVAWAFRARRPVCVVIVYYYCCAFVRARIMYYISIREEGNSLPEGTATAAQQSLSQGNRQQKGSCCFGFTSPGL